MIPCLILSTDTEQRLSVASPPLIQFLLIKFEAYSSFICSDSIKTTTEKMKKPKPQLCFLMVELKQCPKIFTNLPKPCQNQETVDGLHFYFSGFSLNTAFT